MSDENQTEAPAVVRQSGPEALLADLKRHGEALLPGAAAIIAQRHPNLAHLAPDRRAEKVAELIESPVWARYRNPEAAPPPWRTASRSRRSAWPWPATRTT
jgi:hypothetical protein